MSPPTCRSIVTTLASSTRCIPAPTITVSLQVSCCRPPEFHGPITSHRPTSASVRLSPGLLAERWRLPRNLEVGERSLRSEVRVQLEVLDHLPKLAFDRLVELEGEVTVELGLDILVLWKPFRVRVALQLAQFVDDECSVLPRDFSENIGVQLDRGVLIGEQGLCRGRTRPDTIVGGPALRSCPRWSDRDARLPSRTASTVPKRHPLRCS